MPVPNTSETSCIYFHKFCGLKIWPAHILPDDKLDTYQGQFKLRLKRQIHHPIERKSLKVK